MKNKMENKMENKTKFINLAPHMVRLNDGREFQPEKIPARVESSHTSFVDDVCEVKMGEVTGLPEPEEGVKYIVSLLVLQASSRRDLVAPASGHPGTIRANGFIVSVPGFIEC